MKKFRAWDKKNKWMDSGPFWIMDDGTAYEEAYRKYNTPNTEIELTGDLVLMQFTGLLDREGKEIYEGDVLESIDDDFGEVAWNKHQAGFGLKQQEGFFPLGELDLRCWKVIGNIHEGENNGK